MPESPQIRFGEFEVSLPTGEIRKRGIKLKMAAQPFQVLAALLEKPGDVVTREELRQKLWPDGTFVDFDHGLTKAVNRIRDVLGDSAESPRFVETLPRRGYRFIGAINHENASASVGAGLQRLKRDTEAGRVAATWSGTVPGPDAAEALIQRIRTVWPRTVVMAGIGIAI